MNLPEPIVIEVSVSNKKLDKLRILHISDLHVNKKTSKESLKKLVWLCDSLNHDFVIITGDIIDCKIKFIKEKLCTLNKMKKVYWISGNHDLYYGYEDLKKELNNFECMDNKYCEILFNNNIIQLVGLPDRFSKFFKIRRDIEKISNLLKSNFPTIFIAHQPKDYKIAVKYRAQLFLCGHTHGGQIFPFHYLVRLTQPFLHGLHYLQKTAIYVNKGLGYWGINYRYKAPSEITILELKG